MKTLTKFLALAIALVAFAITGCDRAPSNVKTLQTTDCGVSWTLIKPGERVPTTVGNVCGYNTVLPDYPMQGDAEFLTQFQGNILVRVKISYDYQIVDAVKFLKVAKFLGKAASTADSAAKGTAMSQFESAENVVIDVQLRELTTSSTLAKDIVTFNPSDFEDSLFKTANKALADRGVELNSMSFVTVPEDQTRMAIDAATAMQVYRSKGMESLGKELAVARASSTRVNVYTDRSN